MGEYKCTRCGKSAKAFKGLEVCENAPCPMEYVSPDAILVSSKLWKRTKIAVLVLGTLLIIAIGVIVSQLKDDNTANIDTSYFDRKIDQLTTENDSLKQSIKLTEETIDGYDHMVDSLLQLPPQIKTEYVKIYERVDNATVIELVNLSDSIYSAEGISR